MFRALLREKVPGDPHRGSQQVQLWLLSAHPHPHQQVYLLMRVLSAREPWMRGSPNSLSKAAKALGVPTRAA